MRKINYFLILLFPLIFQACVKENLARNVRKQVKIALENVEFTCDGIKSEYYFHAFLKGEELCYSVGFDDYLIYNAPANGVATEGPIVNFSDTASFLESGSWLSFGFIAPPPLFWANYQDYFQLETPVSEFGTTPLELAEKYLKIGELPIRSSTVRKEDGFRLLIEIPYRLQENEIGGSATFNTENGTQEGSHLEITKLEKSEDDNYYYYDLTFEFNCKLYFQTFSLNETFHEFFGDLTEGILVTRLSISKR